MTAQDPVPRIRSVRSVRLAVTHRDHAYGCTDTPTRAGDERRETESARIPIRRATESKIASTVVPCAGHRAGAGAEKTDPQRGRNPASLVEVAIEADKPAHLEEWEVPATRDIAEGVTQGGERAATRARENTEMGGMLSGGIRLLGKL